MIQFSSSSSDVNEIDDDEPSTSASTSNNPITSNAAQPGFGSASGPAQPTSSTTTPETDSPVNEQGGPSSSNPSLQDWDTLSATSLGPNTTSSVSNPSNSEEKPADSSISETRDQQSDQTTDEAEQNLGFGSAPGSNTHVNSEGVSFSFGGSQNQ